jgi:hypothetical protein
MFVHLLQAWKTQSLDAHATHHSSDRAQSLVMWSPGVPQATGPHYLDTSVHHDEPVALHRQLVPACDPPPAT